MYVSTYEGKTLLHSTSDVQSRGRGPMEVRGVRNGPRSMRVTQRIYKAGGGHITLRTDAALHFTDVGEYFGGSYWKVHQLARFELRRGSPDGASGPVLRTSPKLNYCLRDLDRTRPGKRSPRHTPTTPAATRTRASAATSSAPRSAGRTSTPPTTTSSTSTSAACTAASSSR